MELSEISDQSVKISGSKIAREIGRERKQRAQNFLCAYGRLGKFRMQPEAFAIFCGQ
jgi:hypothetical protein